MLFLMLMHSDRVREFEITVKECFDNHSSVYYIHSMH